MGNVIPFRRSKVHLPTLVEQLGYLSAQISALVLELTTAKNFLVSTEKHGQRTLQSLSKYHEDVRWTVEFCNKCQTAWALGSLEEMVWDRDELSGILQDELKRTDKNPRW